MVDNVGQKQKQGWEAGHGRGATMGGLRSKGKGVQGTLTRGWQQGRVGRIVQSLERRPFSSRKALRACLQTQWPRCCPS